MPIIQGDSYFGVNRSGVDREGQDEQKIIWEREGGGFKMHPWGVMDKKKILSNSGLHFRLIFCMSES